MAGTSRELIFGTPPPVGQIEGWRRDLLESTLLAQETRYKRHWVVMHAVKKARFELRRRLDCPEKWQTLLRAALLGNWVPLLRSRSDIW